MSCFQVRTSSGGAFDDGSTASAVSRVGTGAAGSIASGEAPIVTCPGWCVITAVNDSLDVSGGGIPKRLVRRTNTDGRFSKVALMPSFCASLCVRQKESNVDASCPSAPSIKKAMSRHRY